MAADTKWVGSDRATRRQEPWNGERRWTVSSSDRFVRRGGAAASLLGGVALGAAGMMVLGGTMLEAGSSTSGRAGVAAAAAFPRVDDASLGAVSHGRPEADVAPASDARRVAEIRFAPHAVGTVARTTPLWSSPGGGVAAASVAGGTTIQIGGMTRTPAGLGTREVLWVRVVDGAAARFGFVAAEDVVLAAGDAPILDMRGVAAEALVAPGLAVSHGSGEAGSASVSAPAVAARPSGAELVWLPDTVSRWSAEFVTAGAKYGVDPALLAIVTLVESGGNPRAVSPSGAVGLMQIMPPTGAGIAREKGTDGHTTERLYEPAYNIDFGAYYLAQQLASFGVTADTDWQRSVELAASAYNGGPGSVRRYLSGGSLPVETQRYQRWVGGLWRERRESSPATLAAWLAAGGQGLVDRARLE